MIRTSADFQTDNKKLDQLYRRATELMSASLTPFCDRRSLTDRPFGRDASLLSGILGAETLASYDFPAALDCVMGFLVSGRPDGRIASRLAAREDTVYPKYDKLTGLCFIREAIELFYLSRKKEVPYLDRLYRTLLALDAHLWAGHDMEEDGCLALRDENDSEDAGMAGRFPRLSLIQSGDTHTVSPFPVASVDMMAMAFAVADGLSVCATLLKNGQEKGWADKAEAIREKLRAGLWNESAGACFDRDYRGGTIETLTLSNLMLLYHGAADREMADRIMQEHLLNPKEFFTAMPLPTVAANDRAFDVGEGGRVKTLNIRRAIRAFENYGYYVPLAELGRRYLRALVESETFPALFDPHTGCAEGDGYTPAASCALEFIKRFWGIYVQGDTVCFGALGTERDDTSTYRFLWGSDEYTLFAERKTTSAFLLGKHLFTVTRGTRVFTDMYGDDPRVVNVTCEPIDCVFVHKSRTYSFTLTPGEIWQGAAKPTRFQNFKRKHKKSRE